MAEPSDEELLAEAIRLSQQTAEAEQSFATGAEATPPGDPTAPAEAHAQPQQPPHPHPQPQLQQPQQEQLVEQLVAMSFSAEAARQAVLLEPALAMLLGEPAAAATPPPPPAPAPAAALLEDEENGGVTQAELLSMHGMQSAIQRMQADGGEDAFWRAKRRLDTLIGNILRSPEEPKYRKINTANKTLSRDVFALAGARELLLQCGFEPWAELAADGSVLVLPVEAPLAKLREGQAQLLACAEASIAAAGGPTAGGGAGGGAGTGGGGSGSFRCKGCSGSFDQRRRHGPRTEMWQSDKVGVFQYKCRACADFSLCEECYDGSGRAGHPPDHEFEIIGPEEPAMKGAPMPPPMGGKHGRRGPWG